MIKNVDLYITTNTHTPTHTHTVSTLMSQTKSKVQTCSICELEEIVPNYAKKTLI